MMLSSTLRLANLVGVANKSAINITFVNFSKRFASTDRLYTKTHEWISIKGDKKVGRVGITNHAQEALGDVVYVGPISAGAKLQQFGEAGEIESVKAASDIRSPVTGEVIAFNSALEGKPGLVNSDCYGEGWLFDVKIEDEKELSELMKEEDYDKFTEHDKE